MTGKVIAVDFDGTLCENKFPEIGEPKKDILDAVKKLKQQGNKIILWSCRSGQPLIRAVTWCAEQGLLFDAVNENLPEIIEMYGGDTRKVWADIYLDDKNGIISHGELFKFPVDVRTLLSPLTGEDNEWDPLEGEHADGVIVYQNKRCPSVCKEVDLDDNTVRYHDVDAVIVSDNGGITWFTSRRFRKEIEFPYMPPVEPERVYIEYKEDVPPGFTGDEYDIITDNPERIKALYERKRKEFDEAQRLKGIIRKSSAKPWGEGELS